MGAETYAARTPALSLRLHDEAVRISPQPIPKRARGAAPAHMDGRGRAAQSMRTATGASHGQARAGRPTQCLVPRVAGGRRAPGRRALRCPMQLVEGVQAGEALADPAGRSVSHEALDHARRGERLLDFLRADEVVVYAWALDGEGALDEEASAPLQLRRIIVRSISCTVVDHGHLHVRLILGIGRDGRHRRRIRIIRVRRGTGRRVISHQEDPMAVSRADARACSQLPESPPKDTDPRVLPHASLEQPLVDGVALAWLHHEQDHRSPVRVFMCSHHSAVVAVGISE